MYGDIPLEGDDVNHLRGWTPGEGSAMGSRYHAIPPPRSDTSRSRSGVSFMNVNIAGRAK